MQFHSIAPKASSVNNSIEFESINRFSRHYRKTNLAEDFSPTEIIDLQLDNTMVSLPMTESPELAQYAEHELPQNGNNLHCQKLTQTHEQQQLNLLSTIIPENIFNSESSILVHSNIPLASSVYSFMGFNNASLITTKFPVKSPSSALDSTMGPYMEPTIGEGFSRGENSAETTSAFPAQSFIDFPTMAFPTTSLEGVVSTKRKRFPRPHNLSNISPSYHVNGSSSMFLDYSKFPLVRGYRCGGNYDRPPSKRLLRGTKYVSVRLKMENVSCKKLCLPEWNVEEIKDHRRIIRIERKREFNEIVASFSIVGSASENPETNPSSEPDVEVLEVSCLQWPIDENKDNRVQDNHQCLMQKQLHTRELSTRESGSHKLPDSSNEHQYYITSVEVIKIIELLVGNSSMQDGQQKRNERARIRSNLVPFWSKYSLSPPKDSLNGYMEPTCRDDNFSELLHRIMSYKVRRPRVFNKNVRIMKWSELGPALQRALQSYFVAVPTALERDATTR